MVLLKIKTRRGTRKKNILKIMFFMSSLSYGVEINTDSNVDNLKNPLLLKKEILSSGNYAPGENLINKAVFKVKGTNTIENNNLVGIRAYNHNKVDNKGTLDIESLNEGIGIDAINSNVLNSGLIKISGDNIYGIKGKDSSVVNSGTLTISGTSSKSIGVEVDGGQSINKNKIVIDGKSSQGMSAANKATQENKGIIVVKGRLSTGIEGRLGSVSTNSGLIQGSGFQSKGMASSDGSKLENKGTITMSGIRNYGIAGDNKSNQMTKNTEIINNKTINMSGDSNIGMIGLKVETVRNAGTINVTGNNSTGILYTQVKNLLNDGEIKLTGVNNWAFSTDEQKSTDIKSVGKISILNSKKSGALKVSRNIKQGINYGSVSVLNGSDIRVLNVENHGEVINEGTINIDGGKANYGIYSPLGEKSINKGDIGLKDQGGIGIYNPGGKFIENSGIISLNGTNETGIYYEDEAAGIINTGKVIIKGNGIKAFDVDESSNKNVVVVGNILIDSSASGSMGAYARNSIKTAINKGVIDIRGTNSAGLIGLDQTKLINENIITANTKESYGIQAINDAVVVNNGQVSNTAVDGVAIYMGIEDSDIYMDSGSSVEGIVYSAGGIGTFHGTNIKGNNSVHNIDYDLRNFSNLDLKAGNFNIKKDNTLVVPIRDNSRSNNPDTKNYSGNLTIAKGTTLTMEAYINKNNNIKNRLTGSIHADKFTINGVLQYKPLDKLYVVSPKVEKIVVPNIYTNKAIVGATDKNIKVVNIVDGWNGSYQLSQDKTDLSLVLTRRKDGKYLPDTYYNGVYNHPQTSLDVMNLNDSIKLNDTFEMIEKIHNEEIPYYVDFKVLGKGGSYRGGNTKGYFDYRTYGSKLQIGRKFTENLVYGIGFTQLNNSVQYRGDSKEIERAYILDTKLVYKLDNFKIGGYLGTSFNSHNVDRKINKKYDVNGKYRSNGFKGGLGAQYSYRVNRNSFYKVSIDTGVIYNGTDSYQEGGDKNFTLNISKGSKAIPVLKLGVLRESRKGNIHTEFGGKLNYYFRDTMGKRKGYYTINSNAKYNISPVNITKLTGSLTFGQSVDLSDRFSLFYSGSLTIGKDFLGTSGKVGVKYEF